MAKEPIYITDITLHIREYRPTMNFSKVAEKGRMYRPAPPDAFQKSPLATTNNDVREMVVTLPPDLQERFNRGEVEFMIPAEGLYIFPGKDVIDFIKSDKRKKWNSAMYRSGTLRPNNENPETGV